MLRITETENGKVRGLPAADPRITSFKGIPFAAPPVGKNRWRAPQPCENWEGVRDCFAFGPISVQDTPGLGTDIYCREWHVDPEIPMGEDNLYLNIWTPAKKTDEKLPVLVWYFGGGFQWGYTAEMEFDGERLARRGIVVVSVNYRLGVFGFLSHPEITAEAPDAPGNFGFLDQQAGLRWVHRNIANFGGDPGKITIAGQSAGGSSVMNQLANEDNLPLIHGAVVFSGMIRNPKRADDIFKPLTLDKAEKRGEEFFDYLGVKTLEEARALDPIEIRDKYAVYAQDHPRFFGIQDGKFSTDDPVERFINGKRPQVNVISGNTSDEFIENGECIVERSVKDIFLSSEKNGDKTAHYYYRFDVDIPGKDAPGNFHSVDLWFFFETLSKSSRTFTGHHYDLARQMADYFTNFIKTGDPNGTGLDGKKLPVWEPYSDGNRFEMNFTGGGAVTGMEALRPKQAYNPYLPSWEYIPDGEPHVFGDRVYVYGSHDQFGGQVFCLGDYVCWSAPVNDLKSWRFDGVIYHRLDEPKNIDGRGVLYAPDVTQGPDGRYYLYYVLDKLSIVSVAVCDTPAGDYQFLGYVHYPDGTLLGEKEGDEPQFDPGVLTEGDTTYLFTGFCGIGDKNRHGAMLTVLGKDMLTISKAPRIIAPGNAYAAGTPYEGHAFFEGPSIRKKDGKYYFIYSSEVMHELCYAVADKADGEYTYGGVVVSNVDIGITSYKTDAGLPMAYGANNHGSIEKIGDDWYIFYHRHTNNTWYSRQGCAEKLHFRPDGGIDQAEITSCGLNGGPLSDIGEYPAYIACHLFTDKHTRLTGEDDGAPRIQQDGADGEICTAYLNKVKKGVTAGFKSFDCKGVKALRIWTRGYMNGDFEIRTAWDGDVVGRITVGFENFWHPYEGDVQIPDGVSDLYLTYTGIGQGALRGFEFLH